MSDFLLTLPLGYLLRQTLKLALVIQIHILTLALAMPHNQPERHAGECDDAIDPQARLLDKRFQRLGDDACDYEPKENHGHASPEPPPHPAALCIESIQLAKTFLMEIVFLSGKITAFPVQPLLGPVTKSLPDTVIA